MVTFGQRCRALPFLIRSKGDGMETNYRTVGRTAFDEFAEKRSRFIGTVCPVADEKSALAFIEKQRRKFWNAAHNVYAYRLREGEIRRYSDDGEPQGTAGIPVLDLLTKENLTDCAVVVTRYFGGVLLGAGGLVRAYTHGAKLAVEAGGPLVMRRCRLASVCCAYSLYGRIASLIPEQGGTIRDTVYTDRVEIRFSVPCERMGALCAALTELSAGRIRAVTDGELFLPFERE